MILDIELGFQITLGHPKCHFPANIDFPDNIGHFEENHFLGQKSWFLPNLMNHNMVWNLAGGSPKFEICFEMCSPGPKDTSKSPECHYSMPEFDFIEISKILFFTNFTCIWPFWWKLSKIVIFWCLKKYHLDIKRLHPRYSEVSLGPGEHMSRHISNFGQHAAKYGFIL